MCEPLTLTAMGLAAAGTVLQQMGRAEQQDAMSAAAARGNEQSRQYATDANKLFQDSLGKANREAYDEAQAKAVAQRRALLVPPDLVPGAQRREGESDVTAGVAQAATDRARNDLVQQGEARAELGGGTDAFADINRAIRPNAEGIGFLRRDIDANDALTQINMSAARAAGGGLRTVGSLVSGLGSMAGIARGGGETFSSLGGRVSDGWDWLTGKSKNLVSPGQMVPAINPHTGMNW
jgi:hypothetical protein